VERAARPPLTGPTAAARAPFIIEDERSVFIMSVFRRKVYEVIGSFDETLKTNEDYDFWLRAAIAGVTFYRNDRPLGTIASAATAYRRAKCECCAGS